jgi:6-phosphogluconolactonase (cycloisomerase 2 family)
LVLALSSAAIFAPAMASAHSRPDHPWRGGGDVYVNDNTVTANTVAAFHRRPDGSLQALPGSPFATGGAGTGAGIGSQGSLQTAFGGRYVLAVDAGSSEVSVLAVGRHGSLRPVPGGTVSSGGAQPVSIAVHDDLVYVANAGVGPGTTNYTGFVLGFDGVLHPLPGSAVPLPDGSQPGDVLFNATGSKLAATRVGSSLIDSFVVGHDGRLQEASGAPYPAQGPGPFGSEFRPTDPAELYVSNAHGGAGNGTVSVFRDAWDGTLTPIGSSPFADQQTAPCWVEISHDGRYLFAVNTAQPSISSYAIKRDGTLTLLGSTPFRNPTGLGPVDARLSPDGDTLFVVDQGTSQVSAFQVHGGTLTELPSSPTALPAGATPFGIVVS